MEKKEELLRIVEAILFASGKWLSLDEISSLSRIRNFDDVRGALLRLKEEYSVRGGAIILENEDDLWKLHVVPECIPYIRRIVTKTELTKTVLETLAIIASKAPLLQSEVVRIRTNKAYDHLSILEDAGYISRKKHGRTKIINIAEKFFDYFDIPRDKISERFQKVKELEGAVRIKESLIMQRQADLDRKSVELKFAEDNRKEQLSKDIEALTREIDVLKKKTSSLPHPDISSEMLGMLEVVNLGQNPKSLVEENSSQNVPSSASVQEQIVQSSYVQQPTAGVAEKSVVEENAVQDFGAGQSKEISVEKSKDAQLITEPSSNFEPEKNLDEKKDSVLAEPPKRDELTGETVGDIPKEKPLTLAERLKQEALQKAKQSESKTGAGIFSKGIPKDAADIIDKKAKKLLSGVEESGDNSS
ncbi:SMC-Scp complex subunit ScpB [Candidatus Woesearchaeota archaeon]|nr:SMC-Scp complex subunit ScpB [Candidatus Woesearchaeota archaeon]